MSWDLRFVGIEVRVPPVLYEGFEFAPAEGGEREFDVGMVKGKGGRGIMGGWREE